ncbi:MAG: hypothetical protein GEU83_16180 [Pseudonocardiaceae bacterium]|nr:hypothetical protein [Pseudonocardiaceae bacterium]
MRPGWLLGHEPTGIISIIGVYGGQANPLGVESFATHRLPLAQAPHGYDFFQRKDDNARQGRAASLNPLSSAPGVGSFLPSSIPA